MIRQSSPDQAFITTPHVKSQPLLILKKWDVEISACAFFAGGLPVIATSHTCAPDVLTDGKQGFIVPIRNAEAITEKLAWGIDHRDELAAMGELAALSARLFTWEGFRAGVREAYRKMVASTQ